MSERVKMATARALENAGEDLLWILRTTEDAIAALVVGFQCLTEDTDEVTQLAAGIVECVEDEGVSTVLPVAHALGGVAKRFVGDRLRATAQILETVVQEMELLQQLSAVTDGQAKIALEIKVLNVHTKVEVAHLGEVGIGFEYLAKELADFSRSLAENTDELIKHTENRKTTIQKTKSMLSMELPRLREDLTEVDVRLCNDLAILDSGLSKLAGAPARFKQSTQEIAGQIAGVVVAVQGHDITRQQIEHVQEALDLVSRKMLTEEQSDRTANPEAGHAYAGLTIQAYQLRAIKATIADWTSQIRNCVESILRISASELVGIGPLVLQQEQSMSSQLSHIAMLEGQCRDYNERIRSTLEGVSSLSQLVAEHLQKSNSARNRLRLLTFNSVIEASRLGSQADTICVIADGISEVASQWSKVTEQSSDALRQITSLSERINEAMATFAEADSRELSESMQKTRGGLERLRTAAEHALSQGMEIESRVETMRKRIGEIGQNIDHLDACFGRIDEALTAIEDVKKQLEHAQPNIGKCYDVNEVERLFSATYTNQTERDVLHAALCGGELPAASPSSIGNSVELF